MMDVLERLQTLSVADVMSRDVWVVSANQTMGDAALRFAECDISSAPSVDESGKCIGMLSAVDFVRQYQQLEVRADLAQLLHQLSGLGKGNVAIVVAVNHGKSEVHQLCFAIG